MSKHTLPIRIEPMLSNHIPAVSQLLALGFIAKFQTRAHLTDHELAYFFQQLLSLYPLGPQSHRLVALQEGVVIGTMCLMWKHPDQTPIKHGFPALKSFRPLSKWTVLKLLVGLQALEHKPSDNECYISDITVHPEYRGKGAGTCLLQYAMQIVFREPSLQVLSLHVSKKNRRAEQLYEQLNFRKHSTLTNFASGLLFKEPLWHYMLLHVKTTTDV
ncbi:GNAT family N-acetyltransferase [Paenibacillus aquistagni]|uniref:Acetyltransferase (GNAT) family protein n=1 Tax=Paenibacillus aquistagni TaxID=1852522 RepID=A0A1X7J771_9BACL|nr:GNAT family N-acetyltransferase [Paenibacillus aquistagni]SMG23584.1 Acetyltransferase (GNAT) family protein [Paenibacillus aquistagni]